MDADRIAALEASARAALPALVEHRVPGWVVRVSGGTTKRVNSANPVEPSARLDRVRAVAERAYAAAGMPSRFRLTPLAAAETDGLLAEAGFPQGFRLTLHGPNNRYINDARVVQSVAQMFTRIGVETKVEVMPWSVYTARSAAREFSVALIGWGVNTGETSNPLSALVATPDKSSGLGIANDGGYSNPAVDALLKRATRIMDDSARNALLGEACGLVFGDAAILPLHHEVSVWAARRDLDYATRADQYTLAMGIKGA